MTKYVLDVPDMSCGHCVRRIKEVLDGLGLAGFEVRLDSRTVAVDVDDLQSVVDALERIGYGATARDI